MSRKATGPGTACVAGGHAQRRGGMAHVPTIERVLVNAELAALADRYGRGPQALGLRSGATVAGMLPNSTEALEAKTRASRARGMFTVGDIGYLDADGYLYLCDRKSDMIISGGVNIYPAEIEAELSGHPAVDDVAVFGIPHEDWGEEIKVVVQPAPGAEPGPALTADLLAFLDGRVAKFKLPKAIDYVAELPRDPNGKLYKRRLRDPYWQGRDRAI